ncbi:MAG: hypothetical protein WAW06_05220 [bacterium]
MRSCVGCLIALVVVGFAGAGPCAGPTEPVASWVYPYLDEMMLLELGPRFPVLTGPYSRMDVAAWLAGATRALPQGRGGRAVWLHAMLLEEFAPEIAFSAIGSCSTSGVSSSAPGCAATLSARLGSRLETDRRVKPEALLGLAVSTRQGFDLWTRLRVSANAPELHRVETRPWREGWRASLDQGGVDYHSGVFSVFVGRDEIAWGASRELGLLLSGSAPSADMIRFSARTRKLAFTSFHSKLRRGQGDPWSPVVARFTAGHRLELLLGKRLDLSVSEVIVYGGVGRGLEPAYLNPLTALYAEQWNSGRDDNVLMGGDFSLLFPGRAEVRGEIVVDDFQIDAGGEPQEMGAGLSLRVANPLLSCGSILSSSYYLVTNRTYGHGVAWNRMVQEGRPMGYPEGPDGDAFNIRALARVGRAWSVELAYTLSRRGEGRIDDLQDKPGRSLRFPSGVVETGRTVTLETIWRPFHALGVTARGAWSELENAGNVRGAGEDRLWLSLKLEYTLRTARVWAGEGTGD